MIPRPLTTVFVFSFHFILSLEIVWRSYLSKVDIAQLSKADIARLAATWQN